MSSLKERFRKIKQGALLAGGAALSVAAIAGCAAPVKTVEAELPVKIEPPSCDVDSQPKTYEVGENDVIVIGDLEITKGNNPEGLKVQSKSQKVSPFNIDLVRDGKISIDLKTKRVYQVKGDSVETTCDQ